MHIFKTKGVTYQAVLILVNLSTNTNKGYMLQILVNDNFNEYYIYRKWYRVGSNGKSKIKKITKKDEEDVQATAMFEFFKMFLNLTGNNFSKLPTFTKEAGKYDILHVKYAGEYAQSHEEFLQKWDLANSQEVKELIGTIPSISDMDAAIQKMQIDTVKMPLGELSESGILNAYPVLEQIKTLIESGKANDSNLTELSNKFYNQIPHTTISVLDSLDLVNQKRVHLDQLREFGVTHRILKSIDDKTDVINRIYEKLDCELNVLDPESEEYKTIQTYAKISPDHKERNFRIKQICTIFREQENEVFKKQIGNLHLLWHGSPLFSLVGVLSKGLCIDAPVTTARTLGKGIYFTDIFSHAASYSWPSFLESSWQGIGILYLAEVALGKLQEINFYKFVKPDEGYSAVKGKGKIFPDPQHWKMLHDSKVLTGELIEPQSSNINILMHNEYVVYDEAQIRLRYIVRIEYEH